MRNGSEDAPAPVDPRSGIGMLVRNRRAALDGVAVMTDQLAREFNAGQLQSEPSRLIEIAIGQGAIEARIDDVLRGATVQAAGTDTPPYVADGSHQVSSAELALLDRGVRFRGRTLRRRIAHVQEQLGASSRFQAGLQAARRGWDT